MQSATIPYEAVNEHALRDEIESLFVEKDSLLTQIEILDRELSRHALDALRKSHLAFFKKYGQWDWEVRAAFLNDIRNQSLAYDSYRNGGKGHPFEVWNYTPENASDAKDDTWVPFPVSRARLLTATELIDAEVFSRLEPDAKIVEAFQIQYVHYLQDKDRQEKRGFRYNRIPVEWKEWGGDYDTTF